MKHSAFLKLIAVLLCAAALLASIASGIAIGVLAAGGLYSQDVTALRTGQLLDRALNWAPTLASQYASRELGGCPEWLVRDQLGLWHMESMVESGELCYEILDEEGNVLESGGGKSGTWLLETKLEDFSRHEYLELVEEVTARPEETEQAEETEATEGTEPGRTEENPAEETTEQVFMETTPRENTYTYNTVDPENREREFVLSWVPLPELTVRVNIVQAEDPVEERVWELAELAWQFRMDYFWILGAGLVLAVLLLIYLCRAAGHGPGSQEIRAGGLNRIPIDLYFAAGAMGITLLVLLGYEVGEYLLRQSLPAAALAVSVAGYGCTLIFTCFCFALAAQVKTPGGFWWRGSLIGRCCRLIVVLWNLAVKILAWFWEKFLKLCVWFWKLSREKLLPLCRRTLSALWKLLRFFWVKLWRFVGRVLSWCGRKLLRFITLLPLTWQWLLAAFLMIFALALTVNSYRSGMVLLGLVLTLALVLYGASAFGTLLESAKRMRKGDLDTKVDESFLVGSFREFAQELNGLADVAMVAAQKQLKSERMKTELITNVSHDIKTPLTSIINYVDLLTKPHTDEEQEQYLEVLSRQSQRLKKLVDDLMEMSKASSGNLPVEIETVDAVEAVNQALGEFADKLEKAPLYPVFRQPETPVLMYADGKLTWRVLSNLLSNACKYALPGTRLYVDVAAAEDKVIISLKNISREELNVEADELMERFVRGDVSRNTEGSGLGLNIASSLMQLQKGQLQILVDGDLFKVTLIFPGA